MDQMKKYIIFIFLLLFLYNCKSLQKSITGTWKLSSAINSDNMNATRSSLTPEKVESEMTILLKKDGTFTSNGDLCTGNWKETVENKSVGKYYFKKKRNPDKIFRLEANKCPGMGGDHRIKLLNGKLELYYPSVTGYRIQIFDKQ
jgi:hypothetical protein